MNEILRQVNVAGADSSLNAAFQSLAVLIMTFREVHLCIFMFRKLNPNAKKYAIKKFRYLTGHSPVWCVVHDLAGRPNPLGSASWIGWFGQAQAVLASKTNLITGDTGSRVVT